MPYLGTPWRLSDCVLDALGVLRVESENGVATQGVRECVRAQNNVYVGGVGVAQGVATR